MTLMINSVFICIISMVFLYICMWRIAHNYQMTFSEFFKKGDKFVQSTLDSLFEENPKIWYAMLFGDILLIIGIFCFIISFIYVIIF